MNSFKLPSVLLLVAISFIFCAVPAYSETAWTSTEKPLAFNDVNELLHKNYAQAKEEIRASLGPIILCTSESITLLKGKDKAAVFYLKPRYTGLKQIAHISLGTFVLLTNHTDEDLSADTLERLQTYKTAIEKAVPGLKHDQAMESADEARQRELIDNTLVFQAKVLKDKRVTRADLKAYGRSCAAPDLYNAYGAADSQLTTMDEAVAKWHKEMTPDEWKNLHVIIWTSHMPRNGLVAHQYFTKLLNQPLEGTQIIVAESPSPCDEQQAIDLLVTHILDGKVAVDFFQDPWRLHRDVLSDGATKWLETHKLKGNQ